jgi:hypothetical protein
MVELVVVLVDAGHPCELADAAISLVEGRAPPAAVCEPAIAGDRGRRGPPVDVPRVGVLLHLTLKRARAVVVEATCPIASAVPPIDARKFSVHPG